jgi:hypothetical protein
MNTEGPKAILILTLSLFLATSIALAAYLSPSSAAASAQTGVEPSVHRASLSKEKPNSPAQEGTVVGAIYNTNRTAFIGNAKFGFASPTTPGDFTTWCTNDGRFNHSLPLGSYKVFALGDDIDCGGDPHFVIEYWQEKRNWEEADIITLTEAEPIVTGIEFTLDNAGSMTLQPSSGNTLTVKMGTVNEVSFPPGAVSEATVVTLRTSSVEMIPGNYGLLGVGLDLSAETEQGTPVTSFLKAFTLKVSYDSEDAELLDESSLSFYSWDGEGQQWVWANSAVDTTAKTVTAQLDHLSAFAVLGVKNNLNHNYLPAIVALD